MNTSNPEVDITNHTFKQTGWEKNVNIPFDATMVERAEIEKAPGFAKFYTTNSGPENPLNEFLKIQLKLQNEYQHKPMDLDYLIKNPTTIINFKKFSILKLMIIK